MSREQFGSQDRGPGGYGALHRVDHSTQRPSYLPSGYMNFDEMCEEISKDVYLINSGANKLEKSMQLIGTHKDSVAVRDRIHEASQNTAQVVTRTMEAIRRAVASHETSKLRQVQLDKLTTNFQESVQRFTRLQKAAAEKVRLTGAVDERMRAAEDFMGEEKSSLLEHEKRLEQMMEEGESLERDVELVKEREDRIKQLESDILDVNEIFRDLGAMVHEQGGTIDLIETNVESAYGHVETGVSQLGKAANYQKKARKKMCILLIILLVIAIIISVVIAVKVGK